MAQNIVIIEDSNFFRLRLTQVLQQQGYNVVNLSTADPIAENPHLFLENVDLILADVVLPGISGIDLTRRLNDHPRYYFIPIVLISASSDTKIINEAVRAGASDYIVKPFEDELLLNRLAKLLGNGASEIARQDIEKLNKAIALDLERAIRGKDPLSFLKFKIHSKDMNPCLAQVNNKIRKIDTVFGIGQQVLVILPLTDAEGAQVLQEKVSAHLSKLNILFSEMKAVTIHPDPKSTLRDLLEELAVFL